MARPIVLSNGSLHVGLNHRGLVHDFYYPYVGLENHVAGSGIHHRIGVWIDGVISWLDDDAWQFSQVYPHEALIGHTTATNQTQQIILEFDDSVDSSLDAFLRNIHVINTSSADREIRLFLHQAFAIGDSRSNTDTAQYLPDSDAVLHYRGRRAFVISGRSVDGLPFDQYTVGLFGIEGREGTYRDADDGELGSGAVEHGRVDSTLRFSLHIKAHSSARVHYWIAAGTSLRSALAGHKQIQDTGIDRLLHQTASWWHTWLLPATQACEQLNPEYRSSFMRSLMIIKSQIDKRGAIIASTDTTMLNYSRDAYAYCWPRDGAYIIWPLIRMGFREEAEQFFRFCLRGLHPNGYLMHKYRADGALGSSWHPYVHDSMVAPPIQEDETALVVFLFAQYYAIHPEVELIEEFYEPLIKPMADFLAGYIDDVTHLPKPSYDLWEENFATTTYTVSVVYAALLASADVAQAAGDSDKAVSWRSAADDIAQAGRRQLYNPERQAFYKSLLSQNGGYIPDQTIDLSSFFGAFMFGLFSVDSDEITRMVATIKQTFQPDDNQLGLPRYENDSYQRTSDVVTGNWWPITSLWLAQYYLETEDTASAYRILEWVKAHMLPTGVLAEQINPLDNTPLSVSPLTWSHAEYVATLLDTIPAHSNGKSL